MCVFYIGRIFEQVFNNLEEGRAYSGTSVRQAPEGDLLHVCCREVFVFWKVLVYSYHVTMLLEFSLAVWHVHG